MLRSLKPLFLRSQIGAGRAICQKQLFSTSLSLASRRELSTYVEEYQESPQTAPLLPTSLKPQKQNITVVFQDQTGIPIAQGRAKEGQTILDVAHDNNVDLEGACESSLACSTCHVILEKSAYDQFEPPQPEEDDMLELASGMTETSRLGCQVKLSRSSDGVKVIVPGAKINKMN